MTDKQRTRRLQQAADTLMAKIALWVEEIDPEAAGTQTIRHLCATLKDLKELCQELDQPREQAFTVTIEGGEASWND